MVKKKISSIKDIERLKLVNHNNKKSVLSVINDFDIKFKIKRIFSINSPGKEVRGNHAHFKCSQFFQCLNGSVKISCFDGFKKKNFLLKDSKNGILIPPLIWSSQYYIHKNTILLICCDIYYNKNEYITDLETFNKIKRK